MKTVISITNKKKLLLEKLMLIIFSVWSYIPIIIGLLIPMVIVLPLAYASWIIFSPLFFGSWKLEGYIPISPDYPFLFVFILIIELIIFVGGVILFLFGLYHLAKERKHKITIAKTGLYNYIRHPQNLGISLIFLPFALYIPGFIDFIIHEYYIHKKEINDVDLKKEFGNISRNLFAEWNIKSLKILDDDKIYPPFLTQFLS